MESLSRVENGKESPNRIKFQQLMERLGVDKSRYNGHLATSEYRVLEIDGEIEELLSRECYKEAKDILGYLESFLDMSEIQNIQLVQRRRNQLLGRADKLSAIEEKKRVEELLDLTYNSKAKPLVRLPFKNETYLFNAICLMLWKMGEKEVSIQRYLELVKCFEENRIKMKYHFRSVGILLSNMSDKMERIGYFKEAEYWIHKTLQFCLCCGKSSNVEWLLGNMLDIMCEQHEKRELCLEMAKHSIWCSELYKQKRFSNLINNYVKEHFGEV